MKNSKLQLLHPAFLACVLLLLVNDFWLKAQYHNFFTGKLSDIAGLCAFPFFFSVVFPKHKKLVYIITAVLFMGWKSFLSTPLINLLNTSLHIPLNRVVDYTDLVVLFFLPVMYIIPAIKISASSIREMAIYPIAAISLFAFCATSMVRRMQKPEYTISISELYQTKLTKAAIMHKLDSMKINYVVDSFINVPVRNYNYYPSEAKYYIRHRDSSLSEIKNFPVKTDSLNELWYSYHVEPYVKLENAVIDKEVIPAIYLHIYPVWQKKFTEITLGDIELTQQQFRRYIDRMNKTKRSYRKKIYEELIKQLLQ